jgi:hypothetical protein
VNILSFGDTFRHVGQAGDFLLARPGFNDRAAIGGIDKANRDGGTLMDFASEVEYPTAEKFGMVSGEQACHWPTMSSWGSMAMGSMGRGTLKSRMLGWLAALISALPSADWLTDISMLD